MLGEEVNDIMEVTPGKHPWHVKILIGRVRPASAGELSARAYLAEVRNRREFRHVTVCTLAALGVFVWLLLA